MLIYANKRENGVTDIIFFTKRCVDTNWYLGKYKKKKKKEREKNLYAF